MCLLFQAVLYFNTIFLKSSKNREIHSTIFIPSVPKAFVPCIGTPGLRVNLREREQERAPRPSKNSWGSNTWEEASVAATNASEAAGGRGKCLKFRFSKFFREGSNPSEGRRPTNMPTLVQRQAETNLKNTGFLLIVRHSSWLGPFHFMSVNPSSKFMI